MVGLDTIFVIAAASIDLAFNEVGLAFDGHGGLSAGGTTRLLLDYPEPQRSEILDYLFLPSFGASVAVLKLEIGGDTQSTDGAEPSHMHSRYDLGCDRGYEGWLAAEAQRRNPSLKIWSLAWGVPGWIGNVSGHAPTYYCDDNMNYTIAWLKCLRDTHGVRSDYLGLWNERPQGSVDYVIALRKALDREGFPDVGITVEATWQPMIKNNVLTNPAFNASIVAASKHYPCNCSTFNYWILRNNRGGYGADISVLSENSVMEGSVAYSCCADITKSCGVGAKAGVNDKPFTPSGKSAFFENVIWRNNTNINACPPMPTGPE